MNRTAKDTWEEQTTDIDIIVSIPALPESVLRLEEDDPLEFEKFKKHITEKLRETEPDYDLDIEYSFQEGGLHKIDLASWINKEISSDDVERLIDDITDDIQYYTEEYLSGKGDEQIMASGIEFGRIAKVIKDQIRTEP